MKRFALLAAVFLGTLVFAGCATADGDGPTVGKIEPTQQEDKPTSPTGMDSSGVAGQN